MEYAPLKVAGERILDLSRGMVAAIPSWPALRLLAPAADVRLLVAAAATLADTSRLGYLFRSNLPFGVRPRLLQMDATYHHTKFGHVSLFDRHHGRCAEEAAASSFPSVVIVAVVSRLFGHRAFGCLASPPLLLRCSKWR